MKEELKHEKTTKNWQLTRINSGWQMTRVEGKYIACRDLTLLEKIRYYRIMKSNIQYSKFYNNKEDNITLYQSTINRIIDNQKLTVYPIVKKD